MYNSQKKDLTKADAVEMMMADVRFEARELKFGSIWLPSKSNPALELKVHNGLITQIELLIEEEGLDRKKVYRAQ